MGTKGLRQLQLGQEGTEGTAVAASARWRGMVDGLEDNQNVVAVEEEVGYLSGTDRTYIDRLSGTLNMPATPLTFQQVQYLLAASVSDVTTSTPDSGTGDVYAYSCPTTSIPSIQTFTLEAGDDQQAEEMNGAFVESFELSGKGGEAWMMSAVWRGRTVTNTTFTGSIALPTVTTALFGKTSLYIDAIGGTIGTTQVTGSFLGATIRYNSGWKFKYSGDGYLYPTIRYFDKSAYLLELVATFEHDSAGVARKTDWRAETPRLVRIQSLGAALGTGGTYTYETFRFDCAAKVMSVPAFGDQEGNDILEVTMRSRYNSTAATHASFTVVADNYTSLP